MPAFVQTHDNPFAPQDPFSVFLILPTAMRARCRECVEIFGWRHWRRGPCLKMRLQSRPAGHSIRSHSVCYRPKWLIDIMNQPQPLSIYVRTWDCKDAGCANSFFQISLSPNTFKTWIILQPKKSRKSTIIFPCAMDDESIEAELVELLSCHRSDSRLSIYTPRRLYELA